MNALPITSILVLALLANACKKEEEPEPTPDDRTLANFNIHWNTAWGTPLEDDFSGAVVTASNDIIFTGSTQPDGYAANVFIVKTDGQSIQWAKELDTGDQDFQPSPSSNGHADGGGGARCIDIDASGNTYITGSTKQGFHEAFVVKYDPAGTMAWQVFWEANNSGLGHGSAKAFAIDEAGGKIFVTGTTGGTVGGESSHIFLLVLDATSGAVLTETTVGIDPSAGYNDMAYVVRSPNGQDVYLAGWEGQNNSALLMKFSDAGATFDWYKRMDIGWAGRFTDLDFDGSGNLYLAADLRGVSTYLGVVKTDPSGNIIWSKQFQGESNDRNNISCLRVINNEVYVGGRGSFSAYDPGLFGDGLILKISAAGSLLKQYNYFTNNAGQSCGERIEAILPTSTGFLVAGETWPEFTLIHGDWYIPEGNWTNLSVSTQHSATTTLITGDGSVESRTFTETNLSSTLYSPAQGTQGSSDVQIFHIQSL